MKRSKLAIHAPRDKPKKRRGVHKKSKNKYKINESHNMRYYYKDELIMILKKVGFETIGCYNWMTETEIEDQTWYGCIIAKKAHN